MAPTTLLWLSDFYYRGIALETAQETFYVRGQLRGLRRISPERFHIKSPVKLFIPPMRSGIFQNNFVDGRAGNYR